MPMSSWCNLLCICVILRHLCGFFVIILLFLRHFHVVLLVSLSHYCSLAHSCALFLAFSAFSFVDALGLGTLFAAFMQKGSKKLKKTYGDHYSESAEEEHCVTVISSLLLYTTEDFRRRLLDKFAEEEFEKLERLVDLHLKFARRVEIVGRAIALERRERAVAGNFVGPEEEEEFFAQRLEGGLFTLQLVDLIIGFIAAERKELCTRLGEVMRVKGVKWEDVREVLGEYAESIGEEAPEEVRKKQKEQITNIIETIGNEK